MSAYEQRIEPPDRRWQYLLFAAEPYETISFKVKTFNSLREFYLKRIIMNILTNYSMITLYCSGFYQ